MYLYVSSCTLDLHGFITPIYPAHGTYHYVAPPSHIIHQLSQLLKMLRSLQLPLPPYLCCYYLNLCATYTFHLYHMVLVCLLPYVAFMHCSHH